MKVTESTIKKIILEELQSLIESPQSQSSYEYAGYMAATRPDQFGGAYPQPGTEEYEWFMKGYDAGMADRNGIGESAGAIDESDDEVDEFAWGYDDATSGGPPQSDSQEYMDGYNDSRMTQGLDQFMAPAPGSGKPLDPSVLKNAFSSRAQRELDEDDAAGPDGSAFAGWTDDKPSELTVQWEETSTRLWTKQTILLMIHMLMLLRCIRRQPANGPLKKQTILTEHQSSQKKTKLSHDI